MIIAKLEKAGVIHPPKWLSSSVQFLTIMGSTAYGVSTDTSDVDLYGFCVPPKDLVFPHTVGEIPGFGRQVQRFEQWTEHHIKDPDGKEKTYDATVYGIVKYFQLVMENNPNMIDSLFVPRRCVLYSTQIGEMVREKRRTFLHKGAWHKFKGYSYSQLSKIRNKTNASNPKRAAEIEAHGYDLKFAAHTVRLMGEIEQILIEHDLDIQRNREQIKSIRRGEWTLEQVEAWFHDKERQLEFLYATSTLRHSPDEEAIKELLLNCLEHHYGSLEKAVHRETKVEQIVADLQALVQKYA